MKKTTLILISVGVVFLFVMAFGIYWKLTFHPTAQQMEIARVDQQDHTLPEAEALKLLNMEDKLAKAGKISDGDLAWMLSLVAIKKTNDTMYPERVHSQALDALRELVKTMSSEQEERIYQATLPLLHSNSKLDVDSALATLGYLRDKRAIPYVTPFLGTPSGRLAQRALDKIAAGPAMGAPMAG